MSLSSSVDKSDRLNAIVVLAIVVRMVLQSLVAATPLKITYAEGDMLGNEGSVNSNVQAKTQLTTYTHRKL